MNTKNTEDALSSNVWGSPTLYIIMNFLGTRSYRFLERAIQK